MAPYLFKQLYSRCQSFALAYCHKWRKKFLGLVVAREDWWNLIVKAVDPVCSLIIETHGKSTLSNPSRRLLGACGMPELVLALCHTARRKALTSSQVHK